MASRSDAGKQRMNSGKETVPATSPPLGGVSECFLAGLRTYRLNLLAGLPRHWPSVDFGFRTCLPLRGSSGLSPDSLFILPEEEPRNSTTISRVNKKCNPIPCEYFAERLLLLGASPWHGLYILGFSALWLGSQRASVFAATVQEWPCAGQASPRGPVRREARANRALSRSGVGNETLLGFKPTHCLDRDGKRQRSRQPKVRRPACPTTMEALAADHGCAEDAVLVDWNR